MPEKHRRYNKPWKHDVYRWMRRYPEMANDKTIQSGIHVYAIEKAIECTEKIPETGHLRVEIINAIYFKKTHNFTTASFEFGVSERDIQRWSSSFSEMVGRFAGYE